MKTSPSEMPSDSVKNTLTSSGKGWKIISSPGNSDRRTS
jgi:hypothetical protein